MQGQNNSSSKNWPVTACLDFASASAREEFEAVLKKYTW